MHSDSLLLMLAQDRQGTLSQFLRKRVIQKDIQFQPLPSTDTNREVESCRNSEACLSLLENRLSRRKKKKTWFPCLNLRRSLLILFSKPLPSTEPLGQCCYWNNWLPQRSRTKEQKLLRRQILKSSSNTGPPFLRNNLEFCSNLGLLASCFCIFLLVANGNNIVLLSFTKICETATYTQTPLGSHLF